MFCPFFSSSYFFFSSFLLFLLPFLFAAAGGGGGGAALSCHGPSSSPSVGRVVVLGRSNCLHRIFVKNARTVLVAIGNGYGTGLIKSVVSTPISLQLV